MSWDNPVFPIDANNSIGLFCAILWGVSLDFQYFKQWLLEKNWLFSRKRHGNIAMYMKLVSRDDLALQLSSFSFFSLWLIPRCMKVTLVGN